MAKTRVLAIGVCAGLLMLLAACGASVPAGVPTVTLPVGIPTIGVPAAVQSAIPAAQTALPSVIQTALPPSVQTALPGAIQTAAGLPAQVATAAANTLTVQLAPENNSGESGVATLTEVGGKTTVVVVVQGEPAGASQPMHIHDGNCGPSLGGVKYPLTSLTNGASTTTVDVTIAQLKSGKYAINGHKSASDMATYVYCGNITQ